MEFIIRNMVCRHCVEALTEALHDLGFHVEDVSIGSATIRETALDDDSLAALDARLRSLGFERISNRASIIAERVKAAVRHHVRDERDCRLNLSACLSGQLNMSYDTLSRYFTQVEGRTIEKYHIAQKVEYVKELISYGELTLSEIADRVGYTSVAHLSRQFKSVTGLTPTEFANNGVARSAINEV